MPTSLRTRRRGVIARRRCRRSACPSVAIKSKLLTIDVYGACFFSNSLQSGRTSLGGLLGVEQATKSSHTTKLSKNTLMLGAHIYCRGKRRPKLSGLVPNLAFGTAEEIGDVFGPLLRSMHSFRSRTSASDHSLPVLRFGCSMAVL